MRALRLHIDRIERLARGHEQPVALLAAEADIGAGFGQQDLPDARAVSARTPARRHSRRADPAGTDPDVALGVDSAARRGSLTCRRAHVDQTLRVRQLRRRRCRRTTRRFSACRVMRDAGVADIELLVVVAESDAVGLEGSSATLATWPVSGRGDRPLPSGAAAASRYWQAALIDADRAVAGIGEPDRLVVGMHDHVVRPVERLAIGLLGQCRHRAVDARSGQAGCARH